MKTITIPEHGTIGVFAPSSYIDEVRLNSGLKKLQDKGFKTHTHPQSFLKEHQSAGSAAEKVKALHDLYQNPAISAVLGARGGNRAITMLDSIDYAALKNSPKPYFGFSDSTALLCALYKKSGISGGFAPLAQTLNDLPDTAFEHFISLLTKPDYSFDLPAEVLNSGVAEGVMLGGTLSVLCSLLGTGYAPDFTGAILYLEDVGEELSRIDRMLCQLKYTLPFNKLSAIIFGQFDKIADSGTPFGFTLEDIIRQHTAGLNIPIVMQAPFGHSQPFYALPFGIKAKLNTQNTGFNIKLI